MWARLKKGFWRPIVSERGADALTALIVGALIVIFVLIAKKQGWI